MNLVLRKATLCATALGLAVFSCSVRAADDGGWDWMVAPYGWLASLSTDLHTGKPPNGGISSDTNFGDIVDKINGVFELHVEGQGDHFGLFGDYTYLGLSDGQTRPRFQTDSQLDSQLFELAGVWNPSDIRFHGLEMFAGLRSFKFDLTVNFDPTNPRFGSSRLDADDTFNDFMLGLRYTWALSDRWGLTLRGDGSWGDTDGTWNASVTAQYQTKYGKWLFAYRYLYAKFPFGSNDVKVSMYGPMIGYGFTF